ncbi:MAG: phenylacetic acid degradation protein, partial [Cryomorphaceae bacterium]|nr:phenylacetic acid degradation protein [Cryomorphaceae bacterium]
IATGTIVHAGKRTHLWQVDIREEGTDKLACSGRLTVMIIDI